MCNKKAVADDRLLECQEPKCKNGKFFHLNCLNYKRRPNNSSSWRCNKCKSVPGNKQSDSSQPLTPPTHNDNQDEVIIVKATTAQTNTTGPLATLTNNAFAIILCPTGWLTCDIIQQVHVCLQRVNPAIKGFQRPTLGPCKNFSVMTTDFVQILHTGNSHWVCVSTIDCDPGTIRLYDSLYNDIIEEEVSQQVECLLNDSNYFIEVVPVQQQSNGSDCGVFSAAFATSLVYGFRPQDMNFDTTCMRCHLHDCLKDDLIIPFPSF